MRILFVLAYFHPYIGGLERIFKRLTEGLARKGHLVTVITAHLPGTPVLETVNGVTIHRVRVPRTADRYFFSLLSLPDVIQRASHFDILHTTPYNGAPPAYAAARLAQRPIVYTAVEVLGKRWHWAEPNPIKAFAYRAFEGVVAKLPYDHCVAISRATYDDMKRAGMDPARSSLIYCGVDEAFTDPNGLPDGRLRSLCGARRDDFLYAYFGRPGITKGVKYLLQAAPEIQRAIPNARLALIISHEPRNEYEQVRCMAEAVQPTANVHLISPTTDRKLLASYLRDADCIVIPSLTEGFGLTTVEACAVGRPVVATRVGSIPEVISGRHLLIEPGRSDAIVESVLRVWRGECEWQAPKHFSWDKMVDEYIEVYRGVLGCA